LSEGDTLYWWFVRSGKLRWELRVREPVKVAYDSYQDVYRVLRQAYGLYPEGLNLSQYVWGHPVSGWLLAFAVDVVDEMDIEVPSSLKPGLLGARNGFVLWERIPDGPRAALEAALPAVGRRAQAVASPEVSAARALGDAEPPPALDRTIPLDIRRRVYLRDARRCQSCGRSDREVELHIDHIYPWSRGGPSIEENLQLLCRDCNLSKGNRVLPGQPIPPGSGDRQKEIAVAKQWASLRDSLTSPDAEQRGNAALELGLRTPNLEEAIELLEIAQGSPNGRIADLATAQLALRMLERDEVKCRRLAEAVSQSKHVEAREIGGAVLAYVYAESDPMRAEALARDAISSADAVIAALGSSVLIELLPPEHQDMAHILYVAHERGNPELRAYAALELALRSDGSRYVELLGEAMGSPDRAVAAEAAIELAQGYERVGEHEMARKLATDASLGGDEITVQEARELLASLDRG
jgi:hypothetical protein